MSRWQIVRVDHHARSHHRLLLEAVAPLVRDILARADVEGVFVRSHWANGPHLLIGIDAAEGIFRADILPRCRDTLEAWMAAHPPSDPIDRDRYAGESIGMARSEGLDLPSHALMPHGRVSPVIDGLPPPMGLPALVDVRNRFQADALDLVLDLVALRARDRSAFLLELAVMFVALGRVSGDDRYDFWPTSMRAHADGYLSSRPDARRLFENYAARLGPALVRRLHASGLGDGDRTEDWIHVLRRLNRRLVNVVADQHRALADHDVYASVRALGGGDWTVAPMSAGARTMMLVARALPRSWRAAAGGWFARTPWAIRRAAIMKTMIHLEYRIMINFVYGLLPVLGVAPVERACACFLVWRSCETDFPEVIENARLSVQRLGENAMLEQAA